MEHLVRVVNEKDRQTLQWLRCSVGDAAIAAAVRQCVCDGADKPWLSAVCRSMGITPPAFDDEVRPHAPSAVAEQSLAAIRAILSMRNGAAVV